jgi:hypothetical protein
LFVGQFSEGLANGPGFYVTADGVYYEGTIVNNYAETENGTLVSPNFIYTGAFKNNKFHGRGK